MTKNLKKRVLTSVLLFLLLFLSFINNYVLGYILIVTALFSILEFFGMTKIILKKYRIRKFFINSIFLFYIFYFCSAFLNFSSSLLADPNSMATFAFFGILYPLISVSSRDHL